MKNQMQENTSPAVPTNRKTKLMLVLFFMLIIGIILGVLISTLIRLSLFTVSSDNTIVATSTPSVINTNTPIPTNTAIPNSTSFTGTYVTATLPTNWTITESSNFESLTLVSGTVYSGLAKLTIKHNNNEIITFSAVDGVGDTGECEEIYKFSDTDPNYVQARIDRNLEFGYYLNPEIIDLSGYTYSEYQMLGNTIRRIGNTLYFKNEFFKENFNPDCDLSTELRGLAGLGFSFDRIGQPYTSHGYFVHRTIPSTFTAGELQELDQILQSLEPV